MATQTETLDQYTAPPLPPFELDTIPKVFFDSIDRRPRPDAVRFKRNGQWISISHKEMEKRTAAFAAALKELGVRQGDRIAVMSENRPEWAVADYATLGLGAVYVPIYSTLPANQIGFILNDCSAVALLVSTREQYDKIAEVRGDVPSLKHLIAFDALPGVDGVEQFEELLARGTAAMGGEGVAEFRRQALSVDPGDVATLIYTSGTMGNPKGVMLTHHNLTSNVAAVKAHHVIREQPGDIGLSFLPLSHVLERMVDYYYWAAGICIAYAESIEKVADNLMEVHPHYMVSVPRLFEKIYTKVLGATGVKLKLVMWAKRVGEEYADLNLAGKTPGGALSFQYRLADRLVFSKLRARTGGSLRAAISGGAPLSGDVARFFFAAGLPVYEGYGLTETSPVLTANRPGKVRLGTVGQAVAGTEIRIDPNGEILARGPQIMKGYWNRPDATRECIDAEGWFHTGDVGAIDEDGFLRITDRIKNIIVTAGGKNIAPQPIENEVALSPFIAQVVMLGDRRSYPTLLIVPDFDNVGNWARGEGIEFGDSRTLAENPRVREMLEKEAFSRLQGLARYEMPKKIAVVPSEFTVDTGELTPSLKVKRRVVEQKYASLIEGLYKDHPAE